MLVIPAINSPSFEDAKEKILKAAEFSGWIHIDVVDGKFAPNVTWGNPEDFLKLKTKNLKLNIEVHLMVVNPEQALGAWLKTGRVKRIIVHLESMKNAEEIILKCKAASAEVMLAVSPNTNAEKLLPYIGKFKEFQILAVSPGLAGQKFLPEILDKIKFLREHTPGVTIEVDGGINADTAKLVKEEGADIVVSASYIFGSLNPKRAYEELKNV